jgi:hypothetical protein
VIDVTDRVAAIRARIAGTGREPDGVALVAVTKGFGSDAVEAANAAGILDVGENYAQELAAKAAEAAAADASNARTGRGGYRPGPPAPTTGGGGTSSGTSSATR